MNLKRILFLFMGLIACINLGAQTTKTVGSGANYTTLKAAFDAINAGTITGNIVLQLTSGTTETATAALNASGSGSASYTSVSIYPTTASPITLSGSIAGALISFNGADNVTLDGRTNGTGSNVLTLTNTNTGTTSSTLLFINTAETNTVKYCTVKGSSGATTGGIINFTTASTGNGNSGNIIDYCTITNDGTRPYSAVASIGSTGYENRNNTISNCTIYDIFRNGGSMMYFGAGTYGWTISGNSLYETTSITSGTFYGIYINNTSNGNNFLISGNYFGGNAAQCGGGAMTISSTSSSCSLYAFYLNVGTTTPTSVQGNTIANIATGSSSNTPFSGIYSTAGNLNIGTVTGNTIGSSTVAASITATSSMASAFSYGININSSGVLNFKNNIVGGMTATNTASDQPTSLIPVFKGGTGNADISNNTIGSTTVANSISANATATTGAQLVYGIYSTTTGIVTINNNTVANLKNAATGSGAVLNGIYVTNGINNTINNNSVHDLISASTNNSSLNAACIVGISLTNTIPRIVNGNTIYNLMPSYTFFAGSIIGIYFSGAYSSMSTVASNQIYSLYPTGASSTAASAYGIKVNASAGNYINNRISLYGNTRTTLYGIWEYGAASGTANFYFNSIYIGGSNVFSSSNKSYCLYSSVTVNTRDIRNNVFMNTRSTASSSNMHYPIYIVTTGGTITCDYNLYYVSGTAGTLGYYGANKTSLPIVTSQDAHSLVYNPKFTAPEASTPDLHVLLGSPVDQQGVDISSVTTDFDGDIRANLSPVDIGADAGNNYLAPPTGNSPQTFCGAATINDLQATGNNIVWYASTTSATPLSSSTALVNNTHYYASQNNGTESTLRFDVLVNVNTTPAPTGTAAQTVCYRGTIANLNANGTAIKWYNASSAGNLLNLTDTLISGSTYYATQILNACESANRLAVTATIANPTAPTGSAGQTFCNTATVAGLSATGSSIKWYDDPTAGNLLVSSNALVDATTYYATQSVSGCESQSRLAVTATVNVTPNASANTPQSFCNGGTVADLTATGTTLKWYLASTGGTALAGTTALSTQSYYVTQTLHACESPSRVSVAVTVNNTATPTGNATQNLCNAATIADLIATGTALTWYDTALNGNAYVSTDALVNGNLYYASQTLNGCESAGRLAVTAQVYNTAAPTGSSNQSFASPVAISDLLITGTAIKWYNASTGGTLLLATDTVTDGTTYYASQTLNGCESSSRLGIIVSVSSPKTVIIHLYLEGLYDAATSLMLAAIDGNTRASVYGNNVADKIDIELHEATAPYGLVGSPITNIDLGTNGIAVFKSAADLNGDYYIKVSNRNHLSIWTAVPVSFSGSSISYDFSFDMLQAYGTMPQVQVGIQPAVFAAYLGDLDQNGWVDPQDFNLFEPDLTAGNIGFTISDFNGGGWVDSEDFNLLEPRITLGNASEYPGK